MELKCVVVIPARDEERTIGGCLRALACQTVDPGSFETIVVLDACRDATREVVAEFAARSGFAVTTLDGPGEGSGVARRLGMDHAAARLLAIGSSDGLIACTDADSRPASDWLERQLVHAGDGARAIAGLVELEPAQQLELPAGVRSRRERDAAQRLALVRRQDPAAEHHHFAGASFAVTAATYRAVGGIEPLAALEDAAFAQRLEEHRVRICRARDVRVRTSARSQGRVAHGLSVDLEVSLWADRRRYRAADFSTASLAAAKGATTVSVVIPTKECADTIAAIVRHTVGPLSEHGLVDELIVVDAASVDGTAAVARAAGATVVDQDEIMTSWGPALGKGDAMWRALSITSGDVVCFLDGDTQDPDPLHLQGLLGPILSDDAVQLVKGTFERPRQAGGISIANEGGRVTELMARPLLNMHEPRLAGFTQPLAGELSARRSLLETIPFPCGYGIEIAVLIDALRSEGLDALAECDLGRRQNRHQPLRALGEMAYAVLAAVERRRGHGAVIGGTYRRPWADGAVSSIRVAERPPLASLRSGSRRSIATR